MLIRTINTHLVKYWHTHTSTPSHTHTQTLTTRACMWVQMFHVPFGQTFRLANRTSWQRKCDRLGPKKQFLVGSPAPWSLVPGCLAPWLALSLSINFQLEMKNDSICNRLHFYLAILLLLTSTSLPCPGYLLLSL